jgi:hypothetical protein
LLADAAAVSLSSGAIVTFSLHAGPSEVGRSYVTVLSASGADPGIVPQPGVFLPLNVDPITFAGLALLGAPLLQGFVCVLDAQDDATFSMHLPPGSAPALAGKTLSVAAVTITASA